MKDNIKAFLDSEKWEYREVTGDEFQIKDCPFCGDKNWHLYWNHKSGTYFCHKGECGAAGNYYSMLRHLGKTIPIRKAFDDSEEEDDKQLEEYAKEHVKLQAAHDRIWKDKKAIEYLRGRGFTDKVIKQFLIGLNIDKSGRKWLSFPYISEGRLKNCKYRTFEDKRIFRRLVGGESILYNEDYVLRSDVRKRVLITEGETDCLSAYSQEIPWVVGVTIGSRGVNSKWIEQLDKFQQIYICFDSDVAGRRGSHGLARRLGYERCLDVQLPVGTSDLNEFFSSGRTKAEFLRILQLARPFDVENVVTIRSAVRQVVEEFRFRGNLDTGIHLPWPSVDRKIGSLLSGDVMILSGIPGVGKTTLALGMVHHFSYTLGIPTLFICLEMSPQRLARKIISLHTEKEYQYVKEEDVIKCYSDFSNYPLFFGYNYGEITLEKVKNTIREAVRRYGIGFVVMDHLHFLIRNIQHMTNEVGVAIREFKLLAEDEGIPICVVVHPRKIEGNRVPSMMDLRDSGLLAADADIILIVHRKRLRISGEEENEMLFDDNALIRAEKVRYQVGGDSWLSFNGATSKFSELSGV